MVGHGAIVICIVLNVGIRSEVVSGDDGRVGWCRLATRQVESKVISQDDCGGIMWSEVTWQICARTETEGGWLMNLDVCGNEI